MLAVALMAGSAAAWLSQRQIQNRIDAIEAEAQAARTPVVVAAFNLEAGQRLTADMAAVRDIPGEWLPTGFIDPARFADVEGSVLAYPVRAGEPIASVHLESERPAALAERLHEGRRAVTIPVDEISSVSGLLQPGDLIDLYVSFEHRGKRVTMPLLQKMRVLATGRRTETPDGTGDAPHGGFSTVTLDASPEEAVKLITARDSGVMTAMLRRPGDGSPASARASGDLPALLGLKDAAPPEPRKKPKVEVIYGDRAPRRIPGLGEVAQDEPALPDGRDLSMAFSWGTGEDATIGARPPAASPVRLPARTVGEGKP
ncbi:MAG: Flp pilus assembly protein CpaB [Pigmentiphaga sp.]|uniref:Flp pilus assembly protein CpaB n=1 Tax=Pigmentiphaga sp. TaxID=1977564 RepID=UPI0029A8E818|nr:Flp pilus assembly protein CpaB [Pigmentiphaga sp.]MDX3907668.1 Flp pilus assembly protein CpaB [Pigmentiphaga sp.]